jgi:hypothetical protein
MKRPAFAVVAVVVLAGCGIQDPYPLPDEPPDTAEFHPVAIGQTVSEAVLFIEARRGVRLEIVTADPIGQLDGATVELYASNLVVDDNGDAVIGDDRVAANGARIDEIVDAGANPPANTVAIVADVTPTEAGRYVLTGLRVTYRINAGQEREGEGSDVVVTVCADDPAPAECDDSSG